MEKVRLLIRFFVLTQKRIWYSQPITKMGNHKLGQMTSFQRLKKKKKYEMQKYRVLEPGRSNEGNV